MRRLILGTAGHIDHGKTALVKRLTGVDTDRLKEEKARGITVDLGFAELVTPGGIHFGVVDVPGHEGFIRNMVAGATGMDLVLLVVAADEGVMPQTREHLAIVSFLGVPRLLVALTKSDLVEEDWLELAAEEVREALRDTPHAHAPILPVSALSGSGIETLLEALETLGTQAGEKRSADLARLPIDRVFTIRGAGTIVTGTLWSGRVTLGERVRILPGDLEARIRSIQLHNQDVSEASAGGRVALGLAGNGIHHDVLFRGQTLVAGEGWKESWMLTCRLSVLPDTGWLLEQGQRVRVHLGTAEVLARVALLDAEVLGGGEGGWVQLRMEEPVLARARDHLVIRSYSPITSIAGGQVVEVHPPKRRHLSDSLSHIFSQRLHGEAREALVGLLREREWEGVEEASLPQRTGLTPDQAERALASALAEGQALRANGNVFSGAIRAAGTERILGVLASFHDSHPLRGGLALEELRQSLPPRTGSGLVDAVIRDLVADGILTIEGGLVRLSEFLQRLTNRQEGMRSRIRQELEDAGLSPPGLEELGKTLGAGVAEAREILRFMERESEVVALEGGLFFWAPHVRDGGRRIVEALGGTTGLGPADFREVLGVTRKYLLPLLRYWDTVGVTTRFGDERTVSETPPPEWGTSDHVES